MDSTLFYISNQTWKQLKANGHKPPGKGVHAEKALYALAMGHSASEESNVLRFDQRAAPCEYCHPFFRDESTNGRSFIFSISEAGYALPYEPNLGDQIPQEFNTFVNQSAWLTLNQAQFPAVLYYHNGTVFVNARQIGFPACPAF